MPAVSISPILNAWQGFTSGGLPLSGGFINSYIAGTSTPAVTYSDSGGTISNGVTITLDSAGRPPNEIWLANGTAYKFIVTDSLGLDPRSFDNITGPIQGTGAGTFTDLTSTGNNIFGNAQTDTMNVGNGDIIKDNAGYTGFGVSPSAGQGKVQLAGSANGGLKLGNQNNTYVNALDWYEGKGTSSTWTPVLRFGGASVGITYTTQIGYFTRIGNMVFCRMRMLLSNKGSSVGVATVAGLPYASAANVASISEVIPVEFGGMTAISALRAYALSGNGGTAILSVVGYLLDGSASAPITLSDPQFTGASLIDGAFAYQCI